MARKKLVLIVDEETTFREELAEALAARGYASAGARDAFEAFQQVAGLVDSGTPPDLLVVAAMMKVVSGAELMDRLEERGHSFPVVFTSYFMDESLFAGLMRRQCVDFLEKPAAAEDAAAGIAAILEGRETERLPSRAVFRRKGGDELIIEWNRSKPDA